MGVLESNFKTNCGNSVLISIQLFLRVYVVNRISQQFIVF